MRKEKDCLFFFNIISIENSI